MNVRDFIAAKNMAKKTLAYKNSKHGKVMKSKADSKMLLLFAKLLVFSIFIMREELLKM